MTSEEALKLLAERQWTDKQLPRMFMSFGDHTIQQNGITVKYVDSREYDVATLAFGVKMMLSVACGSDMSRLTGLILERAGRPVCKEDEQLLQAIVVASDVILDKYNLSYVFDKTRSKVQATNPIHKP